MDVEKAEEITAVGLLSFCYAAAAASAAAVPVAVPAAADVEIPAEALSGLY